MFNLFIELLIAILLGAAIYSGARFNKCFSTWVLYKTNIAKRNSMLKWMVYTTTCALLLIHVVVM